MQVKRRRRLGRENLFQIICGEGPFVVVVVGQLRACRSWERGRQLATRGLRSFFGSGENGNSSEGGGVGVGMVGVGAVLGAEDGVEGLKELQKFDKLSM